MGQNVSGRQTEIPEIIGSPEGVFDGEGGFLIKDVKSGRLYIKRSPLGTKTGWKRFKDEDDAGGGGGSYEAAVGHPDDEASEDADIFFDETEGAERLYVRKSDGTWFLIAGAS